MTAQPDDRKRPAGRVAFVAAAVVIGAAAGLAGVYGIATFERNPAAAECRPAVEVARRVAPLARGEVAAVAVVTEPRKVPPLTFRDGSGAERSLADWQGRYALVNLWATWCVPCRKEMPALDELQAKLGGPGFEVVTINIDTRDPDKPKAWWAETGLTHLAYYVDPSAKVFQDLKAVGRAFGMPTTLLVDPNGCEVAYLAGPAEWASDDALKFIRAALDKGATGAS